MVKKILFIFLLLCGTDVYSATTLTDEVVEIYRESGPDGDYSYYGDSVDRNGNKLY